ncbi:uncharacterized protein KGF55_004952 [Candida pseudojiufengensis]|uniref:uncharacterized protein n=1 Tax=Candida pseudojiufengensis TaxID=497109 RepID=UPI0022247E1B|nr:uncharacterized protein KGF55_004952 [Candida pseudojiufengensis]KAI5959720.1 hypothetical protein KGF55_004952 [Candida pseudojiufengensis]
MRCIRRTMSTTTTTTTPINTRILRVNPESIVFKKDQILPHILDKETEDNLNIASEQLKSLNVIGFPTETVYGLGGSALSDKSVQPIYRAKNRPADNPLIVHISSIQQLKSKLLPSNTEIPNIYKPLIDKFWPGPLTILLRNDPQNSPISSFVTGNQDTFAVRMPQHPVARALIAISDLPLAAPSANSSTKPSPTMAKHVYFDLNGKIPLILDGGSSNVGVESTVVDGLSSPPMLLRPGGISLEEIKEVGGKQWENIQIAKNLKDDSNEKAKTPGMKYKHYSPNAKVILFINCGDGLKIMKEYIEKHNLEKSKIAILKTRNFQNLEGIEIIKSLGVVGEEISRNLFKLLREVDEEANIDYIFVEGIDETNEGLAIMNRLNKAAVEVIKL